MSPCMIPLRGRDKQPKAWAVVDEEDFEALNQHKWHLGHGYATRTHFIKGSKPFKYRTVHMHREILGLGGKEDGDVDHINMNRLDNRRANLRIATRAQNMQNVRARPGASSPYRGVSRTPRGRWMAKARVNNVEHYLGTFDDELEAHRVVSDWRREHMPYAVERDVA